MMSLVLMFSVSIEASLDETELEVIRAGMRRHTQQHVPLESYQDLNAVCRDEQSDLVGVALGETGRGWLHISLLWVREDSRGCGHGHALLISLEHEAVKRQCHSAYLDTFSYQARPFYERHGYKVFGVLPDYPEGHERFFMFKRLATPDSQG